MNGWSENVYRSLRSAWTGEMRTEMPYDFRSRMTALCGSRPKRQTPLADRFHSLEHRMGLSNSRYQISKPRNWIAAAIRVCVSSLWGAHWWLSSA